MRRTYTSFTVGGDGKELGKELFTAVKNSTVVLYIYYCIHIFASPSKLDALVRSSLHGGEKVSLIFISSATSRDYEDMLPGTNPLKEKARKVTIS